MGKILHLLLVALCVALIQGIPQQYQQRPPNGKPQISTLPAQVNFQKKDTIPREWQRQKRDTEEQTSKSRQQHQHFEPISSLPQQVELTKEGTIKSVGDRPKRDTEQQTKSSRQQQKQYEPISSLPQSVEVTREGTIKSAENRPQRDTADQTKTPQVHTLPATVYQQRQDSRNSGIIPQSTRDNENERDHKDSSNLQIQPLTNQKTDHQDRITRDLKQGHPQTKPLPRPAARPPTKDIPKSSIDNQHHGHQH